MTRPRCYVTLNSFVFQTKLMEKDFYKDLEKIKTIGSTYMAAVGLAPTAGAKVSASWGALLGGRARLRPSCPGTPTGPRSGPPCHPLLCLRQPPAGHVVSDLLCPDAVTAEAGPGAPAPPAPRESCVPQWGGSP